jgi:hypothetical protein
MQKNDMGGVGAQHVKWDEDFFEKVFVEAWQCISAVTGHQKSLARFRAIAESLPANEQIPGGTEPKKFGETRYGSRVTMSERMIKTSRIYQLLMLDKEFVDWLDRQTNKTKDKVSNLNAQFLFCILPSIYSCIHIYLHICVTR